MTEPNDLESKANTNNPHFELLKVSIQKLLAIRPSLPPQELGIRIDESFEQYGKQSGRELTISEFFDLLNYNLPKVHSPANDTEFAHEVYYHKRELLKYLREV